MLATAVASSPLKNDFTLEQMKQAALAVSQRLASELSSKGENLPTGLVHHDGTPNQRSPFTKRNQQAVSAAAVAAASLNCRRRTSQQQQRRSRRSSRSAQATASNKEAKDKDCGVRERDSELIQRLIEMGFDKARIETAIRALGKLL